MQLKCISILLKRDLSIWVYIYILARIRLLGRFTTCLAQTKTASRLLFAIGWNFMPLARVGLVNRSEATVTIRFLDTVNRLTAHPTEYI